jgi:hypothetical protein
MERARTRTLDRLRSNVDVVVVVDLDVIVDVPR